MPETSPYLVRKASDCDAARIAEIQVKTWQAAYRGLMPDAFLDGLDPLERALVWKRIVAGPDGVVFLAQKDAHVVGFCDVLPSRDTAAPPEIAEIAAIYVEPCAWGSGAGRSLISAAIDHARDHGFVMITLWVLATNERAKRFYAAAGFEPDGAEKTKERPGFTLHELRYRREV
ncbi:GNAT family N-acetyltransferase [Luteolibacter luteus]|uniref:GNAT family N-acetyltransferase n=1 Tax=Luteolibacter luteus TaxID=2728835 RepID=A0A858RD54_9BACT|nr:GNAT family N-acetyltransferase [Luteolibacter luteus]QJE94528.1 GNAT family N-acetyltransferase [Luteolibacter luteus]